MSEVQLIKLNEDNRSAFIVEENNEQLAEMVIGISDGKLTVYHTEVHEKLKGQGVATKLLDAMVSHARMHYLKVIPLCKYVLAQFKRYPEKYADIWDQN